MSLISAGMILLLPVFTKVSLLMPIKIYLIFDIIGIITALLLFSPNIKYSVEDEEGEKVWTQLKRFRGTGFYTASIFLGLIGALMMGISPFKEPFVESLGFPILFIGSIMAASRVLWFIVGHNLHMFKKIPIKKLFLYEIFFFSGLTTTIFFLSNPYFISLIIAIMNGYYQGRRPLIEEHYLDNYLINQRYKATMLSIKRQIGKLFETAVIFSIGFIMVKSFNLGFLVLGVSAFIILPLVYFFSLKK